MARIRWKSSPETATSASWKVIVRASSRLRHFQTVCSEIPCRSARTHAGSSLARIAARPVGVSLCHQDQAALRSFTRARSHPLDSARRHLLALELLMFCDALAGGAGR